MAGIGAELSSMPGGIAPAVDLNVDTGNWLDGIDLKGISGLASVLGNIWAAKDASKWRAKQDAREDDRQQREIKRQDAFEGKMNASLA